MIDVDRVIVTFDRAIRTVFGRSTSVRAIPAENVPEGALDVEQRVKAAALMRVNHTGEVCAQALYQGQALTARTPAAKTALERAAHEETEHLAWTERRLDELGARKSLLNPVFYAGSFALGAAAGLLGDRWNLGFLAETEQQVVEHLDRHLRQLPSEDLKSRAIVEEMRIDEARHATTALQHGGEPLPFAARMLMRLASRVMTKSAYWV